MDDSSFWRFSFDVVLPRLFEGMSVTLQLTFLSGLCGMALGLCIALARISRSPYIYGPAALYVTMIRGTPLLLQISFVYYALPQIFLELRLSAMQAGVLALSLNAAAYLTEIFRAAIQSIDPGQMEAARALGMGHPLAMRRIVLPQTIRRLIPPVVNELAALAKDTSLVSVIALADLLYVTQRVGAKYLRPWDVYFWAAVGYLIIVATLSSLASYFERRLARRDA